MLALVGAALAPGLALLSYVYLRDSFRPEPISMVLRTFIFGILLVFPIMIVQHVMQTEWGLQGVLFQSLVASALVEEFFKWLLVFHTAYKHMEFDEPYDGIVYSVAVSLGFATLENLLYLIVNGLDQAFWRALFPVSGHALFGIFMGYYMGLGKFTRNAGRKNMYLCVSLFFPVLIHGMYNLILLVSEYWLYLVTPFMFLLWWRGLQKVKMAHDYGSKPHHPRPH